MGESVLYEGQAKFQKKKLANRTLLANALESVAQNDIEKTKLAQYKEKIELIESEQAKLSELRAKIKELSFATGDKFNRRLILVSTAAAKQQNDTAPLPPWDSLARNNK